MIKNKLFLYLFLSAKYYCSIAPSRAKVGNYCVQGVKDRLLLYLIYSLVSTSYSSIIVAVLTVLLVIFSPITTGGHQEPSLFSRIIVSISNFTTAICHILCSEQAKDRN